MLVHVDSGYRSFAHTHTRSTIAGNQPAQKLKEVRIVANEKDVLPIGVLADQLLKVCVSRADIEGRADFDLTLIAKFISDKLSGLERALQGA